MSDRANAFIVILDKTRRVDELGHTINAIKHIKGVENVTPHVETTEDIMAHFRVRKELVGYLLDILQGKSLNDEETE